MNIDDELEKLFQDPLLRDVDKDDLSLFDVPDNLKKGAIDKPDYVAQRIQCANFSDYEPGFKRVHEELKLGKRTIKQLSKIQSLQAGSYYITFGVLLYLERINDFILKEKRKKKDARTRCIFENGTESDIYLDSLRKSITTDGYVVTESADSDKSYLETKFKVTTDDVQDGWIYVLSSLSKVPEIQNQPNLYKIGFSTIPVELRIANAQNDPTYLMDKVKIVASWKTYNMNTQKFENLIHQFFSAVQFRIEVKNTEGVKHRPKEWYLAPLGIIETVISRIVDKSIVDYRYNPSLKSLEKIEEEETISDKKKYDTSGMKILSLNIKKVWFEEIMAGSKDIEYRQLKQSTLGKYTWVSNEDGKRYLKKYDAIRFFVGYNKNRSLALIEVIDTTFDGENQVVEYHLGKVLEKTS